MYNDDEITELESTGLVFGALPEIELRRSYIKMNPDSILVLFSDGIVERQNNNGDFFELEGLKNVIAKNKDKDAEGILNVIFQTADEFGNMSKWEDDATVVVIKRTT